MIVRYAANIFMIVTGAAGLPELHDILKHVINFWEYQYYFYLETSVGRNSNLHFTVAKFSPFKSVAA